AIDVISGACPLFGVICQAIKHHVEMPGFFLRQRPAIDVISGACPLFGVICQAIKHHVEMPGFFLRQ
ncbi:hypothetical protein VS884_26545, partial [Escherichia coli]